MKAYTDIPYAGQAAALVQGPEVFDLNFNDKDFWFWMRVMHFENRYRTIDQLLRQVNNKNILELSSGYSFRGPDICAKNSEVHYIDTDLPDVVATKQRMSDTLGITTNTVPGGKYELIALNALDETEFDAVISRFAPGPVTIVNEGLLMYLNTEEKTKLCGIIHKVLKARGGCWITADIYIKRPEAVKTAIPQTQGETAFFDRHNIEENKFDSEEQALTFFKDLGFDLVTEAVPDYPALSVFPQIMKVLPEEAKNAGPPPKIQATWMLKAV